MRALLSLAALAAVFASIVGGLVATISLGWGIAPVNWWWAILCPIGTMLAAAVAAAIGDEFS